MVASLNGSIFDALLPTEDDYYAESPFYRAGVSTLRSPTPAAETSSQAFWLPFLQNVGGSLMLGLGEGAANRAAQSQYGDLAKTIMGADYSPPEDQIDQVNARTARGMLANLILRKQTEDALAVEKQKGKGEIASLLLKEYGAVEDPKTGKIKQIPELAALRELKEGKDWFKETPQAIQAKIIQADSTTQELNDLANDLLQMDSNVLEFQGKRHLSGTPENAATSKMRLLLGQVVRLAGDVGNLAEQEQARALSATLGNWTSDSKDAGVRIGEAAQLYRNLALKQAESAKRAYGSAGGGDSLLAGLEQPLNQGIYEKNENAAASTGGGLPSVGGIFNGEKVISIKKIK